MADGDDGGAGLRRSGNRIMKNKASVAYASSLLAWVAK